LLAALPGFVDIDVHQLAPGTQIPSWDGAKLFKDLSSFREALDTRSILYGN
jgi:hypothetical protein